MAENNPMQLTTQELTQLHTSTCLLITRVIHGQHCPKLAHTIVQQLTKLMSYPQIANFPTNQAMYQQLLEHWQIVTAIFMNQTIRPQNQNTPY